MTPRFLLDTSALLAHWRQEPGWARVQAYMEALDELVPVDESVALAAFDIGCETTERLPLIDALIAAAARQRKACLVHRDQHMAAISASVIEQIDLATESDPG